MKETKSKENIEKIRQDVRVKNVELELQQKEIDKNVIQEMKNLWKQNSNN